MKTKIFIVTTIVVAFLFAGCTANKDFDYKVTVLPLTYNSVPTLSDMNKAAEVINKRLNYFFSIPVKSIIPEVTDNKISLTIHNIDTGKVDLINKVITDYGKLEFRETYENSEIIECLSEANNMLRDMQPVAAEADTREESIKKDPLFGILSPMITDQGKPMPSCMIGLVSGKDTSQVNEYLKMDQVKALFPGDIKFLWSANPYKYDSSKSLYELHAIKVTTGNKQAPLDGSVITSAEVVAGSSDTDLRIRLSMDSEGAATWAAITRENTNRCIAIVFDGYVRSYPRVMSEITGGDTEITGNFTLDEANDFVNMLNSGQLPYKLKIVEAKIINRE
jgi:preprotein translocase subunit SecD